MTPLMLAKVFFLLWQLQDNPPWIPAWEPGRLNVCIDVSMEPYRAEVTHAWMTWALEAGFQWSETKDCSAPRTIAYRMEALSPALLGNAMTPPPLSAEPWAGDVWVQSRGVEWSYVVNRPLLAAVLIHETGHAFGMPHLYGQNDVMNPTTKHRQLSATERRMIGCLYRGDCR